MKRSTPKIDIKVFNLLVHYGVDDSKNLIHLLEEGLGDILLKGPILRGPHSGSYVERVTYGEVGADFRYLSGYFYRSSMLSWSHVSDGDLARAEEGSLEIYPRARFVIDLLHHHLYWITERGLTDNPYAQSFIFYIKEWSLKQIFRRYVEEAESEFERLVGTFTAGKKPAKVRFVHEYLEKLGVTKQKFKIELVPLISKDQMATYFTDKKFVIESLKITPHIPNATNDDFEDLFPKAGRLASKAKAKARVTLTAEDKKEGIQKDVVREVFEHNNQFQILGIEMEVRDSLAEDKTPLKVSNTSKTGKGAVDVSLKQTTEASLDSADLEKKVHKFFERIKNLQKLPSMPSNLVQRITAMFGKK